MRAIADGDRPAHRAGLKVMETSFVVLLHAQQVRIRLRLDDALILDSTGGRMLEEWFYKIVEVPFINPAADPHR
jgi:hypothetical protein